MLHGLSKEENINKNRINNILMSRVISSINLGITLFALWTNNNIHKFNNKNYTNNHLLSNYHSCITRVKYKDFSRLTIILSYRCYKPVYYIGSIL